MSAASPEATLLDFAGWEGRRVKYIPNHAHGDVHHPDCETGIVSSVGKSFVFVRYSGNTQAQATDPCDLVKA